MKSRMIVAALAVAMVFAARSFAEDAAKLEAKCPVSGKAVNPKATVEFEGGKLLFCCNGCPKAFSKETEKFAAKARHQMLLTGEFEQVHCPISHKDLKAGTGLDVAGTNIAFCCNNCRGKVEKMSADEQVATCFAKGDCFKAVKK